jgi:hypothetical protein
MFGWFTRKSSRERRAIAYLGEFPEDEPAVIAILSSIELFAPRGPREAFEMLAGRASTDQEWSEFKPRWERAWKTIINGARIPKLPG